MRALARSIRGFWLDGRTLRWLLRLRIALWRNGGHLTVERWRGVLMAERPRIRALPIGRGSGSMSLDFQPGVVIGYGTIVEIWAHGDSRLELGPDVKVFEGARLELRGGTIRVGARTMVHDNAVLKSDGELSIGTDSRISYGSCLHCSERMELDDWTGLAEYVTMADSDHTPDGTDLPNNRRPIATEPIVIERNVFFGRGAIVLRGAHIGPNSAVAANAIVKRGEYPGGWLLAGSPAEAVRELSELNRRGNIRPPTHPGTPELSGDE